MIVLLHLVFKAAALFFYLFGGWLSFFFNLTIFNINKNFIMMFIIIILLLSIDFWIVKNISGRFLVGYRWWSIYNDETLETDLIFEYLEERQEISAFDEKVFWTGLYVPLILWSILLVLSILSLRIDLIILISSAIALSVANVISYVKCDSFAKEQISKKQHRAAQNNQYNNANGASDNSFLSSFIPQSAVRDWALNTLLAVTSQQAAATVNNFANNQNNQNNMYNPSASARV